MKLLAKIILGIALLGGLSQFAEAKSTKTLMVVVLETKLSVIVSPIKVLNQAPILSLRGLKMSGWKHTSTEHGHFILTKKNRRGVKKTAFINITGNRKLSRIIHSAMKSFAKKSTALKRRALRRK